MRALPIVFLTACGVEQGSAPGAGPDEHDRGATTLPCPYRVARVAPGRDITVRWDQIQVDDFGQPTDPNSHVMDVLLTNFNEATREAVERCDPWGASLFDHGRIDVPHLEYDQEAQEPSVTILGDQLVQEGANYVRVLKDDCFGIGSGTCSVFVLLDENSSDTEVSL